MGNKDLSKIISQVDSLSYGREKMMDVKKNGERIEIPFSYNHDYIAKIKTIEGYRWHPVDKCWCVPYSEFLYHLAKDKEVST